MGKIATPISHHAKGSASIRINQSPYSPGDLITGQIDLRVIEPFDGKELVLSLVGEEKLDWHTESTTNRDDGSNSTSITNHDDHYIICTIQALIRARSRYEPGTYVLPFECELPLASPPSFDESFGWIGLMRDVRYRVEYTLQLSLPVQDGFPNAAITATLPVHVVAAAATSKLQHPVHERLTESVSSLFGLVPRGNCTLSGTLGESDFRIGEVASLACRVENTSTKPVRKLKARLYQYIVVASQGARQDQKIREVIAAEMLPSGVVTDVEVPVGMDVDREKVKRATMTPSYHGHLLQVEYRVEVKCCFRLCRSTKVDLPVVIHSR